jgi:uncharacterized Rmd1/YagE family protein
LPTSSTQLDTIAESMLDPAAAGAVKPVPASDHMIKLTISHAIAQSVKLTLFEGRIEETIETTKHIPKIMAREGKVPMKR